MWDGGGKGNAERTREGRKRVSLLTYTAKKLVAQEQAVRSAPTLSLERRAGGKTSRTSFLGLRRGKGRGRPEGLVPGQNTANKGGAERASLNDFLKGGGSDKFQTEGLGEW